MVGKYKQKSNHQSWDEINMKAAVNGVKSKEMGWI